MTSCFWSLILLPNLQLLPVLGFGAMARLQLLPEKLEKVSNACTIRIIHVGATHFFREFAVAYAVNMLVYFLHTAVKPWTAKKSLNEPSLDLHQNRP